MAELRPSVIIDAVASYAAGLGYYERVNQHEPKSKNATLEGVTAAVWAQTLDPIGEGSGLSASSARLELQVRTYTNMLAEPQDAIDPRVLDAVNALMAAFHAGFTLGGEVWFVDLLGAYGDKMRARAGYLNLGGAMFRVMDLWVPIIVDDAWPQAA